MTTDSFKSWLANPSRHPLVMGVLNVTPDSFSDGGRFSDPSAAIAHGREMIDAGADMLDIGGESTRPGSQPVDSAEQIRRVVPVIRELSAHARPAILSIDTMRSDVAAAAIDAGATLVNDISGGRDDARMLPIVASRGVPVILMHMLGTPATMQQDPTYSDVVREVTAFLTQQIRVAMDLGIDRKNILVDPGIGFGKTMEHNLALLRDIRKVVEAVHHPVVIGASRKGFIGRITRQPEPRQRVFGTAATVAWSIMSGASVVRVHDVGPMKQVVQMTDAILRGHAAPEAASEQPD
ncbi:MAG: dihydropteroate synthase [Anaerolineae bacterium]|nr:dihydropteroate synthase [Phycisphaerae bacterium]